MFVERRKHGKRIKYYLVHSYRNENNLTQKIRRYLGSDLSEKELSKLKRRAEELIRDQIEALKTDIFEFSLSDTEIKRLNRFNIDIIHLDNKDWQIFTETFVYNTNAIEGSTVLENEIHDIIKKKKTEVPEEIETKGVAKAIEYIRKTKQ
ncbi:Fic family protein, partial [Candidatus Woesearchaeota archaeon]|nr:Fic family protein [Candidatus Woesearchaeota archaeon]